jgi:DNA-binding response OmpR family regulator
MDSASTRDADGASLKEIRVLVVEDEEGIRDFLARGLRRAGFVVTAAADGIEGEREALAGEFDAVVLDMMLPGRSGLEVLATLREARPQLPVLALTARGRVSDRVKGLEAGAIDYLVKPFAMPELVARLRAQLRASTRVSETSLGAAGIELDLVSRRVKRDGREVHLSGTEFDLLLCLVRNHGIVLTRPQIQSTVWRYSHDPSTNNVDVYIGYLRRKLSRPGDPAPIFTVRGVGYRLGETG